MRIVFMGSAEFGVPTLEKIITSHDLCAIVSTPPRPQGRGLKVLESPIVSYARAKNIEKIITPPDLKDPRLFTMLSECEADIFVVVAFRILPVTLFSIPRFGTLNVHASLLPLFRGPAPIQRAIESGAKETGVTVFKIDEGIDTGGILCQERVAIGPRETTPELYKRLSLLGADAMIHALERLSLGALFPMPQNASIASRAPKLLKEEALINWQQPAEMIFNKIRAFKPFPGTYTYLNGRRLGIADADFHGDEPMNNPGIITSVSGTFFEVACARGIIRIHEVKPEGRKSMSVHDFLLGTKLQEGTLLTWTPAK